jgi:hypothetical protein
VVVAAAPPAPPRSPVLGYVVTGGGVAALGAGVYFGGKALTAREEAQRACSQNDERCWDSTRAAVERDRQWSLMTGVTLAAGAVATAAGLYLLLRPRVAARPTTMARLVPAPQGGRVELVGTF